MSEPGLSLHFRGLVDDGLGIALWQADGSGPEPAAVGHTFVTPIEPITAHYYVASRDYVDPSVRGGLAVTGISGAWPQVRAAFARAGCAIEDLVIRLPLTTAGADREGQEWFYRDGVETRYLQPQAPLPLLFKREQLLEFAPSRLVLTEDYRNARDFTDVLIALVSEPTPAKAAVTPTSNAARALSEAFVADLAGRSVCFVVDAIRLTPRTFGGHGRTGACFAEIPSARLEIVEA